MSPPAIMADDDSCGGVSRGPDPNHNLRIIAIFVILVTSLAGTLSPILAKRSWKVPTPAFDFVKYFGSGVIIATAFIHLLSPAYDELGSECLSAVWQSYPFAAAFSMASVFGIFFVELFAFRFGSQMIMKTGLGYDMHAGPTSHTHHETGTAMEPVRSSHADADLEGGITTATPPRKPEESLNSVDAHPNPKHHHSHAHEDDDLHASDPSLVFAHILGVAILEFGVVLHSVIIGLTLAVDDAFKTLFVVLIFHQMFEGLGLGSRLAFLELPPKYSWVPYAASILYSCMTPIGIAIGLGVRTTYDPEGTTASIVSGTLDALSSGVLLYTGLVELLAHEFLFNPKMHTAPTGKIVYASCCIMAGAGIMALLGRWA